MPDGETMRPRVRAPEPQRSIADTVEYGLTALLVIIVIVAALEICGDHPY
jgi:hypothetical protein